MGDILGGKKSGYLSVEDEIEFQALVNPADPGEKFIIYGHKDCPVRRWLFWIVTVIFCGLPWLLTQWYPKFSVFQLSVAPLKEADFILLRDRTTGLYSVHSVSIVSIPKLTTSHLPLLANLDKEIRSFIHHHVQYVWIQTACGFQALRGWDSGEKTVEQLLEESSGLSREEQIILLQYYGKNKIEVEVKSHWEQFVSEVINPFYLFQLGSVIVWCLDDYVIYACCVLIITGGSIIIILRTARQQQESLRDTVGQSRVEYVNVVRRDGESCTVDPDCLVPGDIIEIPVNGCTMACDALLLNGHCIVNEGVLTGESAPATKTPPQSSNERFDSFLFKRHTLYCGTQVLQTRFYGDHTVTAVVINTGFCTAKGELVRSILHPKPLGFKFYEDSVRYVAALFLLASLGIGYLTTLFVSRGVDVESTVLSSLDLITIVVPPALPAAMTSGIVYAQSRLRGRNIFCTAPERINIAGKIKLFCFDKTGTLTEEGLDMWAVMPVDRRRNCIRIQEPSIMDPHDHFAVAMATCHTLTRIDGRISGDPLDLTIFNTINWEMEDLSGDYKQCDMLCPTILKPRIPFFRRRIPQPELPVTKRIRTYSTPSHGEPPQDVIQSRSGSLGRKPYKLTAETVFDVLPYEIGIVRLFPFTSASQSMSVITRCLGVDHMMVYSKGAPEKILELCLPESIPEQVHKELDTFTSAGYRVIALSCRQLDRKFNWRQSQRARRENVEVDMTFLGLIVLKNNLRPNTNKVIQELRDADIRSVMVTGDSLLTAVSVSRECGMVLPEDILVQVFVDFPPNQSELPTLRFESMGITADSPLALTTNLNWHFAIDGRNFALLKMHLPDALAEILVRGTVFARMLPEQKTQLVEALQDLQYVVGMCGDGANDCGALKAAHIGVSLSETENSVAAPFTCTTRNLSSVTYLLKEGRCALVTSFTIFKYMGMYSLIQFITVLILYTHGLELSNLEFLYIDLVITTSLAVVIGRTGPTATLDRTRPLAKLFCASNLVPLFLEILLTLSFQLAALYSLTLQSWFVPFHLGSGDEGPTWENTVVFCVGSFQYLILALVYSKGKPHCQPFFTDYWFMLTLVSLAAFTCLLTADPLEPLASFFELVPTVDDTPEQSAFRILLLLFPAFNLLLSFIVETSFSQGLWFKNCLNFVLQKKIPKNRYKRVLLENIAWKQARQEDSPC